MPKIYTPNTWVDEALAGDERYDIKTNAGAAIETNVQIDLVTAVTTAGTAVDADKMNNLEDGVDALDTLLSSMRSAATELTIASDAVTITQSNHKLQPQSGTADDLSTISGTTAGQSGVLYASDYGTDTITIKHNTGNILCLGGADIALSNGCVAWYSDGTKVFIAGSGGGSSSFSWPGTALSYAAQDDKILIHDLSAGVDKYIEAQNLSKFGPQANALNTYTISGSGLLADYGGYFVEVNSTSPGAYLSCPVKGTGNHAYVVRNIGSIDVPIKLSDGTTITTLKAGETCLLIPSPTYDFKAFTIGIPTSYLDTDGTLAANSDTKIATQKATKTYVDTAVTGLLDFKGATDCSANPNYPSALKGDAYVVSAAGKIGGASGKSVDANDVYLATADNAGGTEASVGTSWIVLEHNLVGALLAANNLSDLTNQGTARTNLGMSANGSSLVSAANYAAMKALLDLEIGTDVQAYNSILTTLAGASANGQSLVTAADYAAMKVLLSLTIGTDVQAYHARLADLAGITYAQGDVLYFNGTNIVKLAAGTNGYFLKTQGAGANPVWAAIAGGGDLLAANNLSDLANAGTARTNLGLAIGTNVQAYDAELAALAGLTSAADSFPYFTGSGTASLLSIVSAIRTLLASADVATFRSNAGLAIGTNVQAYDVELAAIAGLTSAADKLPYFTGSGTASVADFSSFGRTLVDDADAAAARTTLGALGSAGGTLTGAVNLGENAGLELDAALSADGKYSGITEAGTAGATLAFGDLCYLQTSDSRWELVDANAAATCSNKLGMCVLAAASDGSATTMLLFGKIRADAAFPALTIGAPVFASTTAGDIQTTAPSGAADIIRIIGYGNTADELHFCPSNDYFEHA